MMRDGSSITPCKKPDEFIKKHLEYARHIYSEVWYHLVNEYMSQPVLMKMRRTFRDKTCLSSDIASIPFTYFVNSAHLSLKYAI
jgi:uncharacterized C2H2 Zn-finger protein